VHGFALNEQLGDGRDDLAGSACASTSGSRSRACSTPAWSSARDPARAAGHIYTAGRRAVVPLHRLRRREGPRRAARERPVHLLRLRHRLPPQQVRARLRPHHRHLGRRPPRLHPAREGRVAALGLDAGQAGGGAGAVRGAVPRRPEDLDVHPLGRVRHPARAAPRSRQRRLPLLLRAAQVRPAPRLRPRPGQEPEQREPGVLRAVRPCPRVLGARTSGVARCANLATADLGLLHNERELALCARLASFPELVQDAAAGYLRRTRSRST
jgi:hypothetical protein